MPIAAGDPDAHHEFTVPTAALAQIFGKPAGLAAQDPWVLHNGFIHMHTRGKSGRITLERENGTRQVVLDIRDWDFNWQSTYRLEREVLINPADSLKLECDWDNTQANQDIVNGVQQTPQDIEWGDGTGDEMCLMSVLMTQPREGYDYSYAPTVHIETPAYRQQFVAGELVPLKLLLNNFTLHDPGLHDHADAAMHADSGHAAEGADHSQVFEGHYHVYLDTDDDSAEHLTAWDSSYFYQLPDELEPGVHTLRVSLRGSDHHALGIEHEVEFEVVESAAKREPQPGGCGCLVRTGCRQRQPGRASPGGAAVSVQQLVQRGRGAGSRNRLLQLPVACPAQPHCRQGGGYRCTWCCGTPPWPLSGPRKPTWRSRSPASACGRRMWRFPPRRISTTCASRWISTPPRAARWNFTCITTAITAGPCWNWRSSAEHLAEAVGVIVPACTVGPACRRRRFR